MQHGVRRAIRVIFHRVKIRASELIIGMKTGDLNNAAQAEVFDKAFRNIEEIIVIKEGSENARVDEERRFDTLNRGQSQELEFVGQVPGQG